MILLILCKRAVLKTEKISLHSQSLVLFADKINLQTL